MISHRSLSGAFLLAAWFWAATSAGARSVELDAATCRPGSAKTTPSDDVLMGCMMLRKQCANGVEASCARIGLTRAQAGPPGPPVVPPATTRATSTDVPTTTMTFSQSDIDTPPLARDLSDEGRAELAYIGTTKLWIPGGFVSDGQARRPVPSNAELFWTISGQGSGGSLLVRAYPKQKLDLLRGAMSLSAIDIARAPVGSVQAAYSLVFKGGTMTYCVSAVRPEQRRDWAQCWAISEGLVGIGVFTEAHTGPIDAAHTASEHVAAVAAEFSSSIVGLESLAENRPSP